LSIPMRPAAAARWHGNACGLYRHRSLRRIQVRSQLRPIRSATEVPRAGLLLDALSVADLARLDEGGPAPIAHGDWSGLQRCTRSRSDPLGRSRPMERAYLSDAAQGRSSRRENPGLRTGLQALLRQEHIARVIPLRPSSLPRPGALSRRWRIEMDTNNVRARDGPIDLHRQE